MSCLLGIMSNSESELATFGVHKRFMKSRRDCLFRSGEDGKYNG